MSERQNLNFISDGPGSWSVHWPKSLDATGTETVISDPAHPTGGFGHPWAPTGVSLHELDISLNSPEFLLTRSQVRRALHGEFPGYHVVAESTTTNPANGVSYFPNVQWFLTLVTNSILTDCFVCYLRLQHDHHFNLHFNR